MTRYITRILRLLKAGIGKKIFSFFLLLLPLSAFAHSGGVWIANDGCGNWYAIVFHYHTGESSSSISSTGKAGMYIDFDQNGVFDVNGTQYAYNNAGGFTTSNGDFTRFTDWIDLTDKSATATTYANDLAIQNEVLAWLNSNKNFGKSYSLSVAISSSSSSSWTEALVCPIKPLSPGIYKASTSTSSAVETPTGYTNPFDLNYTPTNFTGTLTTTSACGETLKLQASLTQTCVEEYGLIFSTSNTLPAIGGTGVSQQVLWTGAPTDVTNAALEYSIPVARSDEYKTHYIRTYYKQNVAGAAFYVYSPLIARMPLDPNADCDGDGIANGSELETGSPVKDTDGDGMPDYRDLDSDNDGEADSAEGGTADCDGDNTNDFQDLTLNPVFQSQPEDKTVCSGAAASFSITATGGGLSFQWQVDDGSGFADVTDNATYAGATSNQLSVAAASPDLSGSIYRCVVYSSTCQTQSMSEAATLTIQVTPPPTVINSSYELYSNAQSLSANATGSDLVFYTEASGGAGTSTAPTPSTDAAGIQEFWVTQTIAGCESERAKITITINPPNEISGSTTNKPAWFPVATIVDETISISGGGTITNPKVYIANGFQSGDVLNYPGTLPGGISQSFDLATASLNFSGSGDSETWQTIFRGITFQSSSSNTSNREVNYVIGDAVALTVNGKPHYYQYIEGSITWANARTAATSKKLFGLSGYLATINSQEENDFIMNKLQSDGWVGGSDDYALINAALETNTFANQGAAEGRWYWVMGPEKGTPISTNNLSPQPVSGAYTNWNSGEPNNSGAEHYMQLFSLQNGKWNDLAGTSSLGGYLVEFGGYDSDPELKIKHSRKIQYDARPTVTLSSSAASDVNKPYTVTFTFSEAVSGFDETDITAANATLSSFISESASIYTVVATPTAEGEVQLSVPADVCNDDIFTGNAASAVLTRQYDARKPTLASSSTASDPINKAFDVTLTFNEPVSGFDADDITVVNGTKSDFSAESTSVYAVKITPTADGAVSIDVRDDVAHDNAGNGNIAAGRLTRVYDNTQPTVQLSSTSPDAVNASFTVTFAFSEAVTGFDASDLSIENGSPSDFTEESADIYTVIVTPAADGIVTVGVPAEIAVDAAQNANKPSAIFARNYDATRPYVSLTTAAALVINAPYTVTVEFTEDVTGLNLTDIEISNGIGSDFKSVTSKKYSVLITPEADGEVIVGISADVSMDAALNGNIASLSLTRKYDGTLPVVTLASDATQVTAHPFTVTFSFSEAVSDFDVSDVMVSNGSATSFVSVSDSEYTVVISPNAEGEVSVEVPESTVHDVAGNGVQGSSSLTREYDITHPEATLTSTAPNPTNEAVPVTITFSEAVSGFDVHDLMITNGTAASFTQASDREYTVTIIGDADGAISLSLPRGAATDAAANTCAQSETLTLIYDATAPQGYEVAFAATQVNASNVSEITVNVNGAETGTIFRYEISASDGSVIQGTGQVINGLFDLSGLDLTSLPDGELTLSFFLEDEAGNIGAVTTAEILKVTRNVIAVTTPTALSVPIRTPHGKLMLPTLVEVTYSTQEKEYIGVAWSPAGYDGLVAGEYTLTGELILASGTTNLNGLATTLQVTVEKNIAPVGISISNTVFSPSITAQEVLAEFTTQDADDSEFNYTLVNGAGSADNDLFLLDGDKLYLKDNHGLSGRTQFSVRVQSTDPYGNKVELVFTLEKSDYNVTAILIPSTFSPNGDGINDRWVPSELRFYNDVAIEVFDRSGVRLYMTTNPEEGWGGRANGGSVLEGPFFYIIQIRDLNVTKKGVIINLK